MLQRLLLVANALSARFTASGVQGEEVVGLLEKSLEKEGLGEVKVVALVNDTVGTLVARAYRDPSTLIGLIIGECHIMQCVIPLPAKLRLCIPMPCRHWHQCGICGATQQHPQVGLAQPRGRDGCEHGVGWIW